jgi:hypothetical protein
LKNDISLLDKLESADVDDVIKGLGINKDSDTIFISGLPLNTSEKELIKLF